MKMNVNAWSHVEARGNAAVVEVVCKSLVPSSEIILIGIHFSRYQITNLLSELNRRDSKNHCYSDSVILFCKKFSTVAKWKGENHSNNTSNKARVVR